MLSSTLILTILPFLASALPTCLTSAYTPAIDHGFAKSQSTSTNIKSNAIGNNTYHQHHGDGSTAEGWPGIDQWVSFDWMFESNSVLMKSSCTDMFQLPLGSYPSDSDINATWNAIEATAQETGVDERFILAIMMQESGGCVSVWTTHNSVANPGLMQSHAGTHSCNAGPPGSSWGLVNPCPTDEITGTIKDGVSGTTTGEGLAGLLSNVLRWVALDLLDPRRNYIMKSPEPTTVDSSTG